MESELYVTGIKMKKEPPEGSYLRKLPVVRNLSAMEELPLTKRVTFFVGENGVGKSTLIEAVAVNMGFNPEGGTINFNFSTKDTHSALCDCITVCKGVRHKRDGFFLRAESMYNFATNLDEMDEDAAPGSSKLIDSYGGVSLHGRSHGESFMALMENRFGGHGLYILDEPEAALSPENILRLMCLMKELAADDSQFIISTHSPMLMAFPGAAVYELTPEGIDLVPYNMTRHWQITKEFINSPDKMLRILLGNETEN